MFDEFIRFQARLRPEAAAVVTPTRTVTFAAFDADIDRVAAAFGDIALQANEAVAVAVSDPYRQWLAILALARRGVASAPAHDRSCRLRISDGQAEQAQSPLGTSSWFDEVLRSSPKSVPRRIVQTHDGLARVLLSSGTTGESKRVGMTWRIVDAAVRNIPIAYSAAQDGRWLAMTGPATILGFVLTLGGWATGNALLLLEEKPLSGESIRWLRPTLISMVPYQLKDLIATLPRAYSPPFPLRIVTGGSPLPLPLARQARDLLGCDIRSIYGASECGGIAVADIAVIEVQPNAAGYLLPGVEVEIVDGRGVPVHPGATGEIRIRSARSVLSYVGDEAASAASFRQGWFYPGDLGRLSEDGLLIVEGRVDDLFNLGGDKVLPDVIEREVMSCGGVVDAAAFAVPDESGLDRCWLALVTDGTFAAERLEQCMRQKLPWLRNLFWVTVESIPRNAMGKIDRRELQTAARAFIARGTSTE